MDLVASLACYAAGVISLMIAAKNPAAGFLTHLGAWVGGLYLSGVFVWKGLQAHSLSIFEWTGKVETGPLTLLITVLAAASPWIVGWDKNGRNDLR
ncbi:MAG TPA: hypothetical protein DCL54_03885 [Alphaproteobacteria bacterium]|nr:hypothetical protein [Alphaproteobacteria bacterium]HAJ45705.1 hypothetical protein [Alphaproteobacteria bacterium]